MIPQSRKFLVWILGVGCLVPSLGRAGVFSIAGSIGAGKVPNEYSFFVRDFSYGAGVLWEHPILTLKAVQSAKAYHFFAIETGAFFSQRFFNFQDSGVDYNCSEKVVQIPVLLRFWYSRGFSIGFGGYAAIPIGSITTGVQDITPSPLVELGAAVDLRIYLTHPSTSVRFVHPDQPKWFVEAQYDLSLTPIDNLSAKAYDNIKLLIGVKFGPTPYGL